MDFREALGEKKAGGAGLGWVMTEARSIDLQSLIQNGANNNGCWVSRDYCWGRSVVVGWKGKLLL